MRSPDDKETGASGSKARISTWKCVAALLLILLLGASLRFHRITELEPGIQDEASYLLEARFLSSFCAAVWDSGRLLLKEKMPGEESTSVPSRSKRTIRPASLTRAGRRPGRPPRRAAARGAPR